MHVLLALVLLQTPSSSVQPKNPIVKQSTRASAENTSATNGQRNLPSPESKNTGVPRTPHSTREKPDEDNKAEGRIYKVDIVSPPAKPLDTPLFPLYLLFTGIGVFANLWIAFLIFRQSKMIRSQIIIMEQQVHNAAEQVIAAQGSNNRMSRQIRLMQAANEQTNRLIEETKISAEAARKSADAADLTAKRFAQIEGSRIIPTVDWPLRPSVTSLSSFDNGKLISRTGILVSVKCKNEGKITSWITEKRLGIGIFDHVPENPDFENIDIIFHGLQEVPKEDTFKTDKSRVCDQSDDAGSMTIIVIWGIVKYRDIFSDSRYSTFGYLVTVDRKLKRINLPIYNQST